MKANVALALGAAVTLGSMAAAQAQSSPGAAGSNAVIPEKQQPAPSGTAGTETGRSSALSDKLDSTNGVIKPQQNVDPGMTKTPMTPDSAATPVIHPPGTPGGPPGPQAK